MARPTKTHRPEGLDDAFALGPETDAVAGPGADPDPGADAAGGTGAGSGSGSSAAPPPTPVLPALGPWGWARWAWRQLTSMRVALLLLLLLAVAAVPGTVFPQHSQRPEDVAAYLVDHPGTGPWLDRLGFFDVYSSAWFSAIYLLLFVSLVGCILPRSRQHWRAMRGRPPRTPRRLGRFPAQGSGTSPDEPRVVAERAAALLRRGWPGLRWVPTYRVDVHDEGGGTWSVAAERGYLRETGNLVFHLALVALLVAVAAGQLAHFRAQVVVVQGDTVVNSVASYDTLERGRLFDPAALVPFTLRLDHFDATFDPDTGAARDFTAHVTVTEPGADPAPGIIKVNDPLTVAGTKVYLQGNGYAPAVTVRDAAGEVAFTGPVPFLPQDAVYTSRGVIKVPDVSGGQPQIGLVGYLLPSSMQVGEDQWLSTGPQPDDPLLVLSVWSGDLGLDGGVPQNVYRLDEAGLTQAVDAAGTPVTLTVRPGETVDLPDGLGTVTFDSLPRFVALDLRRDPSLPWVLTFALVALAGLATSLFAPRRRLWLRAAPGAPASSGGEPGAQDLGPGTVVTAAGLARGDDVGLAPELDRVLDDVLHRVKADLPEEDGRDDAW